MIGFIRGFIDSIGVSSVTVDNNGIGWEIFVPSNLLDGRLHIGDDVKLYTYLSVSENAVGLYGFTSRDDLEVFRLLLNVGGVGPKAALGVLGAITADDLRFAVLADDAARITKAPGIGKKTAQKIVLELKDKFQLDEAFEKRASNSRGDSSASDSSPDGSGAEADAVQALVALGYSGSEALRAVRSAASETAGGISDTGSLLRAALRYLA